MPTLNIKNPRVYELARELSEATGTSMTSAIELALEQMLERLRLRQQADHASRLAQIEELLSRMREHFGPLDGDPTAELYDEVTGLPRDD